MVVDQSDCHRARADTYMAPGVHQDGRIEINFGAPCQTSIARGSTLERGDARTARKGTSIARGGNNTAHGGRGHGVTRIQHSDKWTHTSRGISHMKQKQLITARGT